MFGRQITPLLRKLCGASPIASSSCRGLPTASSSSLCHTPLLFGGSCSLVFAEEVSNGKASETNAGESANVGLQRLEDGSIISNEHTSKWRIFTDNGREFFLQGRMIEAEKLFSSALEEAKKGFGERDPHVASACNNLIKGRVLGHGHADYAETMFHLGTVLYLQGNAKDAEALIKDSIRILEEGGQGESFSCIRKLRYLAKGWDSLDTVNAAESLSMTLQSLGKVRDARELLERCLDVRKTLLPQDHIQIGANLLGLANLALLNFKNNKFATSEANLELDRAKDLLTNSVRIAQLILDGSKAKRNTQNYGQQYGKNEHPALIILLQSLKALAQVEVAKQEEQKTGEALPFLEAEKPLRHCIRAFKQYGAVASTSTPIAVKEEYASCLKNLLSLIIDTPSDTEHSRKAEVQKLKDEIMCIEEEISLHNNKHKL
uniref:Kinesin light chain n=1 Tax=Chenopodium quinoa TaxID=63459 RepID=A0A803N8N6_CHEQI